MAAEQIIFFEKNKADYTYDYVTATASQGSAYAERVLNRNNLSSWITSGSVDADNTTLTIDFGDTRTISEILLIKHNFKAYTVKYWDGAAYTAFSPAISETTNTADTKWHSVTAVQTTAIQITITGTMVVNSDKYLYQFIATELLGQLSAWPVINNPVHDKRRTANEMLSGKRFIYENVGGFRCSLSVDFWRDDTDLTLVESLYAASDGFLVWLCGGSETQFNTAREGYRLEDIYLMKCVNNYEPSWYKGIYSSGLKLNIELAEATN